jgi:hypothetical protein
MTIARSVCVSSEEADFFGHLVDAVLPDGEGMVAVLQAYFDESGTHDGSGRMCIAGYLFAPAQAKKFSKEWGAVLAAAGLDSFSASDCANGGKAFRGMPADERDRLARKLIALIRERMTFGVAVVFAADTYEAEATREWVKYYGHPYTTCLQFCLAEVNRWAKRTGFLGEVAYFFEAGHRHQREANERMHNIARDAKKRADYHYASHTFIDKRHARPCDAADYLAWHINRFMRQKFPTDGTPGVPLGSMRKDLHALLNGHWQRRLYSVQDVGPEGVRHLFEIAAAPPPLEDDK